MVVNLQVFTSDFASKVVRCQIYGIENSSFFAQKEVCCWQGNAQGVVNFFTHVLLEDYDDDGDGDDGDDDDGG